MSDKNQSPAVGELEPDLSNTLNGLDKDTINQDGNEIFNESWMVEHESEAAPNLSEYEYLRIRGEQPIQVPEAVIKINGETIAAVEDIFGISGESKSGKTGAGSSFIAGSLTATGTISDGGEGVEMRPNPDCKAVIHIDTEQAHHKHEWNVLHIYKRAGFDVCPEHFISFNIRKEPFDQYEAITTGICQAANDKFSGIHSIWIDGGADYIGDVNDPAASNAIIKYFEELAIQYHTAVFIIVHTNPGSTKERGHLGSQLQRKSGGILSVTSENDISFIEPKFLRYAGKGDIPKLMFKFDKDKGYHVGCGIMEGKETDPDAKAEKKISDTWNLCEKIFSGQKSYSREKAIQQIMIKRACQTRTAAGLFALMAAGDMILKGEDDNYRLNTLYSNEL